MEILEKFYQLTNLVSNLSLTNNDNFIENFTNLSIENKLTNDNNNSDFIINFDYINNILFIDNELDTIYNQFFQNHLHLISTEYEESPYSNHLSTLITYYKLLKNLLNLHNEEEYKLNLPYGTLKDILEYIQSLNEYVLFDTTNNTYDDLDNTRKIIIGKIEYLVLLLIDKLKNYNNFELKNYQDISRLFFNTIQLIVYVLIFDY